MFSEPAQPYTILDEMFFYFIGNSIPASRACWYQMFQQASPLAIHLARGCLLVHAPNPILIAEVSSAAARSANASIQI